MLSNFNNIQRKLEAFIRRYYTNELLKGAILFFAIGLLYFLFTLFIEHMLWLNTGARTVLFWLFVLVELALLVKFIFIPLAKLFKLKKGINYEDASKLIGKHFSEVNDKLLNVLQLHQDHSQSELLLASIEQKSKELNPIPFKLAINLKSNLKYLKYAAIPLVIILASYVSGNFNWFSDSYKRVVHYKTAYEPPAPFQFFVVNNTLNVIENSDFKLLVKTVGEVTPENVEISYNDETYFLQQTGVGAFEYVFPKLKNEVTFQLKANNVNSKPYQIQVIEAPSLLSFDMVLDYPAYTKKQDQILKNTGNAIVPEGTKITWKAKTKATELLSLYANDTMPFTSPSKNVFIASKVVRNNFSYSLTTSNKNLKDFENLGFLVDVIKDEYPEFNLEMKVDSLDNQTLYFYGKVSDDYGLSKVQLVYYPLEDETNKKVVNIPVSQTNIDDFVTVFPNNLNISEGIPYNVYFQVFDNDAVNGSKQVKSNVYTFRKRTKDEDLQKQLNSQSETIKDFNKSLKKFEEQEKQLKTLTNTQKEKSNLNFNDKKKLESFFERQKQQDEMMKNFNKKFQENLEQFQEDKKEKDPFKEDLKQRLKDNEEQLKKDEKLLEELKKLQDKISKEELIDKLEDLTKQNKNKKRSLKQLMELTKRFYVEKKLEKLKDDITKLALDQEKLSTQDQKENTSDKQEDLNKRFEDFQKELEDLKKTGKDLMKPIEVPQDKLQENEIKKDQKEAKEALDNVKKEEAKEGKKEQPKNSENQDLKNAQKNQNNAAKKMMNISKKMQGAMQAGGGGEQLQEDAEMLRQILDNLLLFSLDQEALMNSFKAIETNHSKFATYLKKQNNLREYFEHIDDSLFALSLRQPKLSEQVNKEVSDVYYNIDKALNLFVENQLYQGVSNQQFTVTAANNLANYLSDVLDNMEMSMSMSPGQGGDGDMQLPDIIMSQEQLNKMMEQGMSKGKDGQPKDSGNKGDKEQKGDSGKEGDSKSSKPSEKGEKDGSGKEGKDGKSGGTGSEKLGEGSDEDSNGLLYQIYQQQQQLRQQLEDKLAKEGFGKAGDNLLKKMEEVELDLINKGFTNQTLQKMLDLKHQLLKLDNATFQQGEEERRESNTNQNQFFNTTNSLLNKAKQYFNTTEILNKQILPLQPIYKEKVKAYFKEAND